MIESVSRKLERCDPSNTVCAILAGRQYCELTEEGMRLREEKRYLAVERPSTNESRFVGCVTEKSWRDDGNNRVCFK